jgi:hypothetical protein
MNNNLTIPLSDTAVATGTATEVPAQVHREATLEVLDHEEASYRPRPFTFIDRTAGGIRTLS